MGIRASRPRNGGGQKTSLIVDIKMAKLVLGASREEVEAEVKSWYRTKSVEELREILREVQPRAIAKSKERA